MPNAGVHAVLCLWKASTQHLYKKLKLSLFYFVFSRKKRNKMLKSKKKQNKKGRKQQITSEELLKILNQIKMVKTITSKRTEAHRSGSSFYASALLMMEKAQAGEGHSDAVLVTGFDNIIIADRAASLGNILHTAAMRTLDIIAKGEEGITA